MKLNAIAAALVLAATGSAHAAMDNSLSGNGSLILGLIDPVANVSAIFDLGVSMDAFLPGNAPAYQAWNLNAANYGSAWADFTAAADMSNAQFMVFAMDSTGNAINSDRYLSTTNADMTNNNNKPSITNFLNFIGVDGLVNAANDQGTHTTEQDGANFVNDPQSTAFLAASKGFKNGKWNTDKSPFVAWAPVASDLSFYMLTNSSASGLSKAGVTAYADTFALDYANGSLAYGVQAPIPEPETYALMLAGLGLVGFMARRRKAA
ncbi:MAG: PEP-CTERM sorting domain-containing protein [Pseudomonadota bacterium]